MAESSLVLSPDSSFYRLAESTRIRDLIDRFIRFVDVSPVSAKTYGKGVASFFGYLSEIGETAPSRDTVIQYRDSLIANGLKPTTVQTYLCAVRLFFRFLAQEGLGVDIAQHVKSPKLSRGHKKDYLTPNQVRDVLQSCDRSTEEGRRDFALLLLMTVCGLRTIEVVRANVEDLRTVGTQSVLYLQGKGKTEKLDLVRLPPEVESAIRATFADRKVDRTSPLFVSLSDRNKGGRMTTRSISRIAKEAFRGVGLDSSRITAHSLRHTAVTLALMGGVDLAEVQQFARHANIATTQIYAHNLDRMKNHSESAIFNALSLQG